MRISILLLSLCIAARADVVILKDGTRYAGQVTDKGDTLEVATGHGTLTLNKSEVDKVVSDPKEILRGADLLRGEAKLLYESGSAKTDATDKNSDLDAAVKLLVKARGIYIDTRMDFPGQEFAWMDDEVVAIDQAIKLARDKHVLDAAADKLEKEYRERLAALKAGDADGHFVLGEWCDSKDLHADAQVEYETAIKINPEHKGAREKLGYVLYEGRWITREQRDRIAKGKPPAKPPAPDPGAAPANPSSDSTKPVKELIADLTSPDAAVRKAAVVALAKTPDAALGQLMDLLKTETQDEVRKAAIATLAKAKGASLVSAAESALKDSKLPAQFQLDFLEICDANPTAETMGFAAKACLYATSAEAQARGKAVVMKHKKLSVVPIARALRVTSPDMRVEAVKILEEMCTRPSVRAMVQMACRTTERDPSTRVVMGQEVDALERIGKPAVPCLIEAMSNDDLKMTAAMILQQITKEQYGATHADLYLSWWRNNHTPADELKDE